MRSRMKGEKRGEEVKKGGKGVEKMGKRVGIEISEFPNKCLTNATAFTSEEFFLFIFPKEMYFFLAQYVALASTLLSRWFGWLGR